MIASCKTSCAYNQEDAELESVKLALGIASYTRNFLQQLDMDQLGKDVNISLRTSSFHDELVNWEAHSQAAWALQKKQAHTT